MDAFHSTKIFENSGSKSNGTGNFQKLISKISVNLSGNSGNFLFHLTFLPMNRPLVVPESGKSILHWMQNDLVEFEPHIDCLSSTNTLGSAFLKNCALVVPNSLLVFAWFA